MLDGCKCTKTLLKILWLVKYVKLNNWTLQKCPVCIVYVQIAIKKLNSAHFVKEQKDPERSIKNKNNGNSVNEDWKMKTVIIRSFEFSNDGGENNLFL